MGWLSVGWNVLRFVWGNKTLRYITLGAAAVAALWSAINFVQWGAVKDERERERIEDLATENRNLRMRQDVENTVRSTPDTDRDDRLREWSRD